MLATHSEYDTLADMSKNSITIINDKNLRGIVASASVISKEMLEDFIDVVEMSEPAFVKEMEILLKKADRDKSWIPFEKVVRRAKKAR